MMKKRRLSRWAKASFIVALCFGGTSVHASDGVEVALPNSFYAPFEGLHLVDQDGKSFPTAKWAGHLTLFNFIYTGCSSICPLQTRALAQVQQALPAGVREHVRFVSVSIDPLNDTPATLKQYGARMGADLSSWSFVTGPSKEIERLSSRLKLFKDEARTSRPGNHVTWLWLVDRQGVVRQRYAANPLDERRLAREITELDGLQR